MPSGIEVWRLEVDFKAVIRDSEWVLLSKDEQVRALRYRKHEDQVRSIAARAALRRLLAARVGQAPHQLHFFTNPHGKPYLWGNTGLEFNVTHAGRFVLIALSRNGGVGVDIEYCDPRVEAGSLSMQVFSPRERELGVPTSGAFFKHWVAKEAVLKALGLGITEHLQAISVLPGENGCYRLCHDRPEWEGLQAWSLDAPDEYAAALAWVGCTRSKREKL